MAITDDKGRWMDGQCEYIPAKYIDPVDKKRDKLVEKLVKSAEEVSLKLCFLKEQAVDEIEKHLDWLEKRYSVSQRTQEGNKTLSNFSMNAKVEIRINKFIDFDERLEVAKTLIDQCIQRWSQGANDKLSLLVKDAFKIDSKGRLDKHRIIGLRRLEIKDADWDKAMELISDSVQVVGRRSYIRFWKKAEDGQWRSISLDISAM